MKLNFTDNYFELFNLPVSMDVDLKALDITFKALQKELHPDRFANSSENERRWSMQATSLINEARQTLLKPLTRASYLMSLAGIDLANDTDTKMSGSFLMTQMELRESLDSARSATDPLDHLEKLNLTVAEISNGIRAEFTQAYAVNDLSLAREKVREWQFLAKLGSEIDELESTLDDY